MSAARVFTIPPGRPFLTVLARAILAGDLPVPGGPEPSPLDLPDITLLLPTRRSVKTMQEAFLDAADGRAMLLPQIRPIGQSEEDAGLIHALSGPERFLAAGIDLPPAVAPLQRRLVLTQFVLAWARTQPGRAVTPAQASALAKDLGALIDLVETEQCSLADLAGLVPDTHSEHWRQTLDFLRIITQVWPGYLAAQGLASPADRRNRLIEAEARRLSEAPPAGPVIIAGVTGSVPATARLMQVVAGLKNGAVVLPGLDQTLDAAGWAAIRAHPEHPQHGLHKLIEGLGLARAEISVLPGAAPGVANVARARLVGEAMRPAATTDRWHVFAGAPENRGTTRAALDGVSLIEAPTGQDEADAIALILRRAAEQDTRTAALVTPDRNLGRRVAVRLEAWGLRIDDSAGRPLAKTPVGAFLDHAIEAFHGGFRPGTLMALLKHPLTRLGLPGAQARQRARDLELIAFRDTYIGTGIEGVRRAVERAEQNVADDARLPRPVRRVGTQARERARDLVGRLAEAYAPLVGLCKAGKPVPLRDLAAAHVAAAEALAADETNMPRHLWEREEGEIAAKFFARLTEDDAPSIDLAPSDYADFYRSLLVGETVRPSVALHPRLFIWGPFEARLQQPDLVVLGGLNEGTWPQTTDPGAWLNRGMLKALGLPAPEERIGFLAHDFTQLLGAREVVLTRAMKVDGTPAVPSRWLLRLRALLNGMELGDALLPPPELPWLAWAARRNALAGQPRPARRPAPCPPIAVRPRKLSVTAVETWLANPYATYAQHILKLEELPSLAADPGPSLRGSFIHQALHRITADHPGALPDDIAARLVAVLDTVMAEHAAHPRVAAFWRPRFQRFAAWFAETEGLRRAGVSAIHSEVGGLMALAGPAGPFELTARADRIDLRGDGLVITDYKTGTPPAEKQVEAFVRPQLALEAAIAVAGGFGALKDRRVAGLRYISAKGGEPPGEEVNLKSDPAGLAASAIAGLSRRIAVFDDQDTPYRAMRRAQFRYDFDAFAHLARVGEWTSAGGDDD